MGRAERHALGNARRPADDGTRRPQPKSRTSKGMSTSKNYFLTIAISIFECLLRLDPDLSRVPHHRRALHLREGSGRFLDATLVSPESESLRSRDSFRIWIPAALSDERAFDSFGSSQRELGTVAGGGSALGAEQFLRDYRSSCGDDCSTR